VVGAAVVVGAVVVDGAAVVVVDRGTEVLVVVVDRGTVEVVVDRGTVVVVARGAVVLVVVVGNPGIPPVSSMNTWSRHRPLPLSAGAWPKRCASNIASESRPMSLGWIRSSTSRVGSFAVAAAQSTMVTFA
jgi:hypothetical protein